MAVSVNTVYQRVLAIANKEQRGYITPQEFNTLANQAQLDIFEQYFYDINQFNRLPGNSTSFSDMLNMLEEKIAPFKVNDVAMTSSTELFIGGDGVDYSSFEHGGFQVIGTGSALSPQRGWGVQQASNVSIVTNPNNNYTPSIKIDNIGTTDAHIEWRNGIASDQVHGLTGLTVGREYEISITTSYVSGSDDDIGPEIKVEFSDDIGDASPSPTTFSYVATVGTKKFIAKATRTSQKFRITLDEPSSADANAANYSEVNFSEISLREVNNSTLANDVYRLGDITHANTADSDYAGYYTNVTQASANELNTYGSSPLARPSIKNPVYVRTGSNSVRIYPDLLASTSQIRYNYIRKPSDVKWTYNVIQGKALYNSSAADAKDFELHASEEKNLVIKILKLAGIMIEDPNLYQALAQEEVKEIQQEKS